MFRRLVLSLLLLAVSTPVAMAQDNPVGTRIYVALYNIRYSDIPQWTADYNEHFAPVLEGLVSEGSLTSFSMRMHHTGGEYTIRQGFVGDDSTNYDEVWSAYLSGAAQADAAAFERSNRMILAHTDEIWDITNSNIPSGAGTRYMYEAQFQVNFADMEQWNELWADNLFPVMDQAIADGLMQGYVVEGHNTGGPLNWKMLVLYDEWDNFDEIEAEIFGAVPLTHRLWSMFTAHKDELWQAMPPTN